MGIIFLFLHHGNLNRKLHKRGCLAAPRVNFLQQRNTEELRGHRHLFAWTPEENISTMINNPLFNQYYQQLTCKIFILGHPSQGESIVFVLYGDKRIIYSCVVDSFVQNDRVVPKDLLYGLGVDKITDLFWTHPHDDHSNGLVELIETFTPQSIYIPIELQRLPENNRSLSASVLEHINKYKGYDRRCKHQPRVQGLAANMYLYNEYLSVGQYAVAFQLFAAAPCSGKVRKNAVDGNYSTLNDYSVVLELIVGDFSVFLTGDVQNRMVGFMSEELSMSIPTPNILKIPHHGSKDSTDIINLFSDDWLTDIAVTTAKRSSDLPRDEALQYYNSCCEKVFRVVPTATNNAIWGVEVNILNGTITQILNENVE